MRIDPKKLSRRELRQRKRSTQKVLFGVYAVAIACIFFLLYQKFTDQLELESYSAIYFIVIAVLIASITLYLKKVKNELNKRKAYS